jgi:hypothetical protein
MHISDSAKIGKDSEIGYNCVISDEVVIGQNCKIGHNVVIHPGSVIGDHVRIDANSVIGKMPLSSPRSIFKPQKELQPAKIGDKCQIGTNVIIYAQAEIGAKNLIADMATIRENVKIGELNIIGRNVTIENFCTIGSRNKLETNSYITAYSQIEDYCFIAPGVLTSNDNYLGRDKERFKHFKGVVVKTGGRIGVNSTILPGKTIESDGVAAAASVITHDIPSKEIWVGAPAKKYKTVPEAQLLVNNRDKDE